MKKISHLLLVTAALCFLSHSALALPDLSKPPKSKSISYFDIGHGTPLILIHAFPTDKQLWEPQKSLSKHFRLIALDLWGFGESAPTNGQAVTMAEYADEVKQLMDQLHIHKAIIGGESMGGYIALAFLEKYPHKVKALILSDTQAITDSPEEKAKRKATAVEVLKQGKAKLIKSFMSKALSPKTSEQTKKFLQNIAENQQSTGIASALRGMALRKDMSDVLANSEVPILIITGGDDQIVSLDQSQNMHKLSKNNKLVVIPDAGHLSNLDQPEQWNNAVIHTFLN